MSEERFQLYILVLEYRRGMKIPGFTAESSLYNVSEYYQVGSRRAINSHGKQMISAVHPAMQKEESIEVYSCDPGDIAIGEGSGMICVEPWPTSGGGGGSAEPSGPREPRGGGARPKKPKKPKKPKEQPKEPCPATPPPIIYDNKKCCCTEDHWWGPEEICSELECDPSSQILSCRCSRQGPNCVLLPITSCKQLETDEPRPRPRPGQPRTSPL